MVILLHTPWSSASVGVAIHQSLQQHFCRGDKTMIQYLLLQNRQGKTRLSKYYRAYTDDERTKIETGGTASSQHGPQVYQLCRGAA